MIKKIIYIFVLALTFTSCEDVIDVDLEKGKERLVVDASLNWYRDYPSNAMGSGANQEIVLTKTAGYYDREVKVANGAVVTVTNTDTDEIFTFTEDGATGIYKCTNFKPFIGNTYTLSVSHGGEHYVSTSTIANTPVIDKIDQVKGGVFDKDKIVLNMHYKDKKDVENYYLLDYITSRSKRKELEVANDRFIDGNSTYEIISYDGDDDDKIKNGDVFNVEFFEIDKQYYQYLSILVNQVNSSGIFDPAPAEVKGNVINQTNEEEYAYGYFRVVLGNKMEVVIDESKLIDN